MSDHSSDQTIGNALGGAIHRLSPHWKYFLGLGLLATLLGVAALVMVVASTVVSVVMLGVFIVLSGALEVVIGARSRSWTRFFLWMLAGLFYMVAGATVIAQPIFAAAIFTLVLGAGLVATGVIRVWLGLELPPGQPSGMVLFSGAITTALGVLIVIGWPGNSLYVLGLMLGVDLIFYGWGWIGFGLFLRRHA